MANQTDERGGIRSASGMERLYHCSGAPLPKPGVENTEKQDEVTSDGIKIHDALMTGDISALDAENALIAEKLQQIAAREMEKWLWDIGRKNDARLVNVHRETRLWIRRRDNLKPLASAKLDVYCILDDAALVMDYKTGFLEATSSDENIQLRIQALCVWHEHPEINRVRVRIVQYRLGEVRSTPADYLLRDLRMAEEELMFRLYMAEQPDAPRVPGKWCRYCPALADCREAKVYALMPGSIFTAQPVDISVEERVAKLAPIEKKFIWQKSRVIKSILDAVNDSLKAMTPEALKELGLYITDPSNVRSVSNIIDAYALLDKGGFLKGDDAQKAKQFSEYCKMPLGAIEEALTEHFAEDGGTKKAAKAKANNLLKPLIVTTPKTGFLKEL